MSGEVLREYSWLLIDGSIEKQVKCNGKTIDFKSQDDILSPIFSFDFISNHAQFTYPLRGSSSASKNCRPSQLAVTNLDWLSIYPCMVDTVTLYFPDEKAETQ